MNQRRLGDQWRECDIQFAVSLVAAEIGNLARTKMLSLELFRELGPVYRGSVSDPFQPL
jgi:hypothetical protein